MMDRKPVQNMWSSIPKIPVTPSGIEPVTFWLVAQWTHQLHITIYNTTYNIRTSTQYIVINNNTKLKVQSEVEFVTASRYMCIYINIPKS